MKSNRILVTGASGAIGNALKSIALTEYGDRDFVFSSSTDCDLTNPVETLAYVASVGPQAIIHLAARAGGVGVNKAHPATLLRDNVRMSLNILEASRKSTVRKTVMALSSGTYPKNAPLPLNEATLHDGYPDESNYGYAFAKRLIDPMIRAYRSEYGMSVVGLLPNNTIGEASSFREADSGVVPALIRRFYENKDDNAPLIVWGDGTPVREISDAKDIARLFMWALDSYDDAQVLNVGTREELSIRDIAYTIADALEIDRARIVFDNTKPAGPARKNTDDTRFRELIEFTYTPARQTISSLARYFAENVYCTESIRL